MKNSKTMIYSIVYEDNYISLCHGDGDFSQDMNTRVPMEPRYTLRKRTHPQLQQHVILFLIQKFEKLTIHEVSEKDLSKY